MCRSQMTFLHPSGGCLDCGWLNLFSATKNQNLYANEYFSPFLGIPGSRNSGNAKADRTPRTRIALSNFSPVTESYGFLPPLCFPVSFRDSADPGKLEVRGLRCSPRNTAKM